MNIPLCPDCGEDAWRLIPEPDGDGWLLQCAEGHVKMPEQDEVVTFGGGDD